MHTGVLACILMPCDQNRIFVCNFAIVCLQYKLIRKTYDQASKRGSSVGPSDNKINSTDCLNPEVKPTHINPRKTKLDRLPYTEHTIYPTETGNNLTKLCKCRHIYLKSPQRILVIHSWKHRRMDVSLFHVYKHRVIAKLAAKLDQLHTNRCPSRSLCEVLPTLK